MTTEEFLTSLKQEWEQKLAEGHDLCIKDEFGRLRIHDMKSHAFFCPLTFLNYVRNGVLFFTCNWLSAATMLKIDLENARKIVRAADTSLSNLSKLDEETALIGRSLRDLITSITVSP